MLKIVRSRFASSSREAFCQEISRLVDKGERACLIVPEQQTVMAEALMARRLSPSSVLCFEVTNFTRLANTTFRSLGGLSGEYCDSAKKSLIMWRALTELAPTLSMTAGRNEINVGLVDTALAAVAQMQNLGIRPTDLAAASENEILMKDGRLASKLADLSSIFSLYKSLLSEKYADTGDDAQAMIDALLTHPSFLCDTKIFIEGFSSFTEPQYRLISILAARTNVSVALTLPHGMEDSFEYTEIRECSDRLISSARKAGADIKLLREEGYGRRRKEELDEICSYLWTAITPNEKITLQNTDDLRIFEASTPYEECAFVCEDIRRRVIEGAYYSDFAIVCRSAESYYGILDGALSDSGIPAFTSFRRDINEFEAIKLIYTAYAACRGFKREDVISYAKCALSGIGRQECDEFEMYVNTWQIGGRRFTDGDAWNMNPAGYTLRRPDGCDEKLLRIHKVRESIVGPLSRLGDRISNAHTAREHAEILLDFLTDIKMELSLKARAELLKAMGEETLAEENSMLWRVICNSLDTMVSVLGDSPADAEAFLAQLKVVFSATDVGRIPSYVDQVIVGSADMLRLYEKKHIYLIGVNAGKFPATVSDRAYFSERDRIKLCENGLAITPELETRGARELYIFSRAFSYATDSVTISYSSLDTRFKAIEPAEVVGKIIELTAGGVRPVKVDDMPLSSRIYSADRALSMMGELGDDFDTVAEALSTSGYEKEMAVCRGEISNSAARIGDILPQGRSLSLTQSRIDSYVNCPFGYYCRYLIKLSGEERAEFDSRSIGSFIHAILENFFRALSEEGRSSGELSVLERAELTREAARKYIAELGEDVINISVKTRIKIDRLCRAALPVVDGLCEEFSQSAFEPRFFELSLSRGDDATPDPISLKGEGGGVTIYGIIDRVDAYKKGEDVYLRVIDYKTGQKEFSPTDMAEGANLQMFLYLKALVESENKRFRESLGVGEGGRLIPAGVIYVKTSVRDVRVDRPDDQMAEEAVKGAQHREGMILDDPDVISAMTLKYTPVYSKRTPDKIPDNKRDHLYTEEGWGEIMNTVEGAVLKVAEGIRSGVMDAIPKEEKGKSPCDFCDFKPVCRNNKNI